MQGLPITCSTCKLLDRETPGTWRCNQKGKCGGPFVGRDFPAYDGPINRSHWRERCLCCGSSALVATMIVPGSETRFGLCAAHVSIFERPLKGEQLVGQLIAAPIVMRLATN